jgi:hypothetical protein
MTDASTTISLAPWVQVAQAMLSIILPTVVTVAIGWGAVLFQRWTGIKIAQADQDALAKAISTQAGLAMAASATNLAGESITASSPAVVKVAGYITNNLQPLLAATGVTPDNVAHLIAGKIGEMQAATPTVVAALPANAPYGTPRE